MSAETISNLVKEINEAFKRGDFKTSLSKAEEAHALDFENLEVLLSLKCSIYWNGQIEILNKIEDDFERADFLLKEWVSFSARYLKKMSIPFIQGKNSIKNFVFTKALSYYKGVFERERRGDDEILIKMAKCQKGLGFYDEAVKAFLNLLNINKNNSDVIAQLADSYALVDEIKQAKVLFREAFFLNSQKIDIDLLESQMILSLIEKIKRERELSDELLKEWIPVYGTLYGIFNIKRELRPIELGQLKQAVYSIRNEIREKSYKNLNNNVLIPRLINKYFWLIDYYVRVKEDRARIEEILSYIKEIDTTIYQQYVS